MRSKEPFFTYLLQNCRIVCTFVYSRHVKESFQFFLWLALVLLQQAFHSHFGPINTNQCFEIVSDLLIARCVIKNFTTRFAFSYRTIKINCALWKYTWFDLVQDIWPWSICQIWSKKVQNWGNTIHTINHIHYPRYVSGWTYQTTKCSISINWNCLYNLLFFFFCFLLNASQMICTIHSIDLFLF